MQKFRQNKNIEKNEKDGKKRLREMKNVQL